MNSKFLKCGTCAIFSFLVFTSDVLSECTQPDPSSKSGEAVVWGSTQAGRPIIYCVMPAEEGDEALDNINNDIADKIARERYESPDAKTLEKAIAGDRTMERMWRDDLEKEQFKNKSTSCEDPEAFFEDVDWGEPGDPDDFETDLERTLMEITCSVAERLIEDPPISCEEPECELVATAKYEKYAGWVMSESTFDAFRCVYTEEYSCEEKRKSTSPYSWDSIYADDEDDNADPTPVPWPTMPGQQHGPAEIR